MRSDVPSPQSSEPTDDKVNNSAFWNTIYQEHESPRWNIGREFPALRHWLETARPAPGRVLIPGCGFGYDVRLLAEFGFDAVGVDFAELAIERARALHADAPGRIEFRCADIFDLRDDERGRFDYIYEYTCFVAIQPARREEYVRLEYDLLRPGGLLVGAFFNHGMEGGPPWNATLEGVRRAYKPLFEIRTLETTRHSVEQRKGKELWAEFARK